MCGIAGVLSISEPATEALQLVNKLIEAQVSRGPDQQQTVTISVGSGEILLGHNGLNVHNASVHAKQPMWDQRQRYCIVYDGEIYNHRELQQELINLGAQFTTASDTEVLLQAIHLWGMDAINRFNGAFAFALYDNELKKLYLVRDRLGVKPLYYYQDGNHLYFASTTTTLARHFKLSPNFSYLRAGIQFFSYENSAAATPYSNLYAVPASHYIEIDCQQAAINCTWIRYYDLGINAHILKFRLMEESDDNLLAMVSQLLIDAVNVRMHADVPIGISLSGGLDSSTIAAIAAKQYPNTAVYCYGDPLDKKSEAPLAELLARKTGLQIDYILPNYQNMSATLLQVLAAQETPFAGISVMAQYLVYQKIKTTGVKVILGGQGGDEAFMGYRKYFYFWLKDLLKRSNYVAALKFCLQSLWTLSHEASRLASYLPHSKQYRKEYGMGTRLILPKDGNQPSMHHLVHDMVPWQRQLLDVTDNLPTLLRYEDRNSMAHSIESRLPFVDYRLVELGLALPEVLKLRNGYGKWIIREVMKNELPIEITRAHYKRGFDVNNNAYLEHGFGHVIRNFMHEYFPLIKEFMPKIHNNSDLLIGELFSDRLLRRRQGVFAEAITLIWLGRTLSARP